MCSNCCISLSHCIICPDSSHFGDVSPDLLVSLYSYLLLLYLISVASPLEPYSTVLVEYKLRLFNTNTSAV